MTISIRPLSGLALADSIVELARLRIEVFSAWPYLYDGDAGYEQDYLREFIAAPNSVLVAAIDGDVIVGAATASPMSAQKPEFRAPFEDRGLETDHLFYFGESVLLPQYRGQGIGHAFFDHREAHARACGADKAVFAAVSRPANHPARPAGYVPLDEFWQRRGYSRIEGMTTELAWKEHGEAEESPKPMHYWLREL